MDVSTTQTNEWAGLVPTFETPQPQNDFSAFLPQKDPMLNDIVEDKKDVTDALTDSIISSATDTKKDDTPLMDDDSLDTKTLSHVNRLIEEGLLLPFEDSEIKTYSDLKELLTLNESNKIGSLNQDVFQEQLSQLPPQFQSIMKYGLNGGQDIQSLMQDWADAERTINVDISTPEGQEQIVSEYLAMTNYGSVEQIKEDVQTWKDLGKLSARAETYKPILDEMQMQRILQKESEAEKINQQQENFNNYFINSIGNILDTDKTSIGLEIPLGLKQSLYNESMPKYTSQITGRPLDALEAIIEESKYGQNANPAFYTELMLHAAYPDEYKRMLLSQVKAEVAQEGKKLKTQQVQNDMGKSNHTSNMTAGKIRPISF